MPKLTNVSARQVTIPIVRKETTEHKVTGEKIVTTIVLKRIILKPLILETVTVKEWDYLKSLYLIQHMLENGQLLQGVAASRETIQQDDIDSQMKGDLTERELESISA